MLRLAAACAGVLLIGALPPTVGTGSGREAVAAPLIASASAQGNAGTTNPGNSAPSNPNNAPNNGNENGNDNGNNAGSSGAALNAVSDIPVGPNDVLHVDVVGQADLTNDYPVDENGNIVMPYIGKVQVGGLQPDKVAAAIAKQLDTIYNNVTVIVTRKSVGGIAVTLTGALAKQGTVVVRRDAHLNDVLQQAGILTDADVAHVKITRGLPGTPQTTLTIDYGSFLNTASPDGNPSLKDGDVIYLPHKAAVTISVSITGEVAVPGRYDMPLGTTFYDLVTRAGGLRADSDHNGIYIQPLNTLTHYPVSYDKASQNPSDTTANPVLNDGDKVVVPELANQPTFSITGGVLHPGPENLVGQVTLEDAIGMADGFAERAKPKLTSVTRRTPSGAEVIKVDASDQRVAGTFLIQPDDNIYVPQGRPPAFTVNPFEVLGLLITAYAVFR